MAKNQALKRYIITAGQQAGMFLTVLNFIKSGKPMPKLYEYFGLIILFYSNEHKPVRVHGKNQGTDRIL